ncbi:MAG: uracil-DNA glycosylase [Campylobacteraceae bacterium]|jgi:uracil-DNA glycosylase|nr:uracil-DNA glycosylase [Campylobacteraceae bacterium]
MTVHESWQQTVANAYSALSVDYRTFLETNEGYFPNFSNFLNAFVTLPKNKTKAVLFGQDPYPREASAIGYAFIDGMVKTVFGSKGLSKEVNRATSLRNFIKMLLLCSGELTLSSLTQDEIAKLDKSKFITTIMELKDNFENNGILLLNTSLIFTNKNDTPLHVKAFVPFMKTLLSQLSNDKLELILFGNIAKEIKKLLPANHNFKLIQTCHPYNIEFITNKMVLDYFAPMNLLKSRKNCF